MALICATLPGGEVICYRPPAPSCMPPTLWHTSRCECPDGSLPTGSAEAPICTPPVVIIAPPPPPPVVVAPPCISTLTYAADAPHAPQIVTPNPACDAAGLELALAVTLARLLGAH